MMGTLQVLFTTPLANTWLKETRAARVLHVFENSCNLISSTGKVLSLVHPAIGRGPFNLVLAAPFDFSAHLTSESEVTLNGEAVCAEGFTFTTAQAVPWDPRPPWQPIPDSVQLMLDNTLAAWPEPPGVRPGVFPKPDDPDGLERFARELAGRGPGLTPSGDDYLVGWMHAGWCRLPAAAAARWCAAAAQAAAPRTTSLSAAWLFAAANGLAGEPWHRLITSASSGDEKKMQRAARTILDTGHTSGADALAGFLAGLKQTDWIPLQSIDPRTIKYLSKNSKVR